MAPLSCNICKTWMLYIYKKSMGVYTVTHSTLRGLRIAQSSRTSNARTHADMYISTPIGTCFHMPKRVIHILMDTYSCLILDWTESCEVSKRQDIKRKVNAFSIYIISPFKKTRYFAKV